MRLTSHIVNFVGMRRIGKLSVLVIVLSALQFACAVEPQEKQAEITDVTKVIDANYPNKRSELAILMRDLYNDLKDEKKLLENGDQSAINWMEKYGNMLEAEPTDLTDAAGTFEGYGKAFLFELKSYQESNKDNRISTYNGMIASCMNCHKAHCPGPMVIIKKLPVKETP